MEKVLYSGKIFEIVDVINEHNINGTIKKNHYEYVRRSPGVRGIIVKDNKILLTKEYRYEHNKYVYRLPGGKVFDKLEEYRESLIDNTLQSKVNDAIKKEMYEEVGLSIKNPKLYHISKAGSTIICDLYYFVIDEFEFLEDGQHLENGEYISYEWYTYDEIMELIKKDLIKEDRTIGTLIKYIFQTENSNL